jgi:hypothetical protein
MHIEIEEREIQRSKTASQLSLNANIKKLSKLVDPEMLPLPFQAGKMPTFTSCEAQKREYNFGDNKQSHNLSQLI